MPSNVPRLFGAIVAIAIAMATLRCSNAEKTEVLPEAPAEVPPAPPRPDPPAMPQAEPPAAASAPRANVPRRPNDLSGRWRIFARTNEWTVSLEPTSGLPNEYAGEGVRDTPNELGVRPRLKVGALLANGRLTLWIGPGVIVCDARFSATRPMTGQCKVALGEGAPGAFRAVRLPDVP